MKFSDTITVILDRRVATSHVLVRQDGAGGDTAGGAGDDTAGGAGGSLAGEDGSEPPTRLPVMGALPVAMEKAPSELALDLSPSAPAGLKVTIGPKVIERGSPCLFTVTSSEALSALSGAMMGKKVYFNPDQSRKTWYGLAGVAGISAWQPDPHFERERRERTRRRHQRPIRSRGQKGEQRVSPEFTDPDDEGRARIAREALLKRDAFKTLSYRRLVERPLLAPRGREHTLTAAFAGTRRFNRGPVKTHLAPTSAPRKEPR